MSESVRQVFKDWSGIVSVLGFFILLAGGWTSLNSRVTANETNTTAVQEDIQHTRDRVDKIYDYLLEDN